LHKDFAAYQQRLKRIIQELDNIATKNLLDADAFREVEDLTDVSQQHRITTVVWLYTCL
jgi:hypothetical protein